MKKLLVITCTASAVLAAHAWETAITDTTGYVVQTTGDAYGESSIISGNHFPGGAPVATHSEAIRSLLTAVQTFC